MSHLRLAAGIALVLTALLATPAQATPPGDNGLIVWQRETRTGPPRLWVANPDGTGARQVFRGTARQAEFEAAFSPTDPNVLFFSRGRQPFRPFVENLYRGDLRTGAATRLQGGANTADIAPTVSPDGTRLAYFAVARAPIGEDEPPPPQIIRVANLDGSGARNLTSRRGLAFDPDWSPDGTRLVYTEGHLLRRQRRVENRIMMINADGTGRRALTQFGGADEINPKWWPDGRTIVFERARERGSSIAVMPATGGAARVIFNSRGWDTNPVPSPDGTRILFSSDMHRPSRDRINPDFELYTIATDGSGPTRLTTNRTPDIFPDWQRLP